MFYNIPLSVLMYRQISNIRLTKSQNLNVSCLILQLSLAKPLKPRTKSRMKMQLEQRRQLILPTTSEWSTNLLPTKVHLIFEIGR